MNHNSPRTITIIKIVVSALAVINLIALFVFHYSIPGIGRASGETDSETNATGSVVSTADGYAFVFESDTLRYDGTGDLDLLEGVTLLTPSGEESDAEIFSRISPNDVLSEKTIEYTATVDSGEVIGSRELVLTGYTGPSITLPDELPDVAVDDTEELLSALAEDEDYVVDDGFGNDLSSQVSVTAETEAGTGRILCTFSITNILNDTAISKGYLSASANTPTLTLTTSSTILEEGAVFDPEDYLRSAVDIDGSDLMDYVLADDTVDPDTPGNYIVTYTVTSQIDDSTDTKTLNVTVR